MTPFLDRECLAGVMLIQTDVWGLPVYQVGNVHADWFCTTIFSACPKVYNRLCNTDVVDCSCVCFADYAGICWLNRFLWLPLCPDSRELFSQAFQTSYVAHTHSDPIIAPTLLCLPIHCFVLHGRLYAACLIRDDFCKHALENFIHINNKPLELPRSVFTCAFAIDNDVYTNRLLHVWHYFVFRFSPFCARS